MISALNGPCETKSQYAILASNGPYEATLIQKGVTGEDTDPRLSVFARRVRNPPWGPLKELKSPMGCCLKASVKNRGVQGRRGVGGRKPPPLKGSKHARFLAKDEGRRIGYNS